MSLQDTSFLLFDPVLLHFGPEIHTFCGILTFWIKGIPVLLKHFEQNILIFKIKTEFHDLVGFFFF